MELVKFNGLGQWDLVKSDDESALTAKSESQLVYANRGMPVDPNKHKDSKNFNKFQRLVAQHGGGHFSYRPETDEIVARTDHAKNLVANAVKRQKSGAAPTPAPAPEATKPQKAPIGTPPPAPKTSLKVKDAEPPKGPTVGGHEPVRFPTLPKT